MILGHMTKSDLSEQNAAANTVTVSEFAVAEDCLISKLTCYIDGGGPTNGNQVFRGVIYDDAGNLMGQSSHATVINLSSPAWVDMVFDRPVSLSTGDYAFGVHAGGPANAARLYTASSGTNLATVSDTYSDGAATTGFSPSYGAGELGLFATFAYPWTPPDEDDLYLANLGYYSAQAALGTAEADSRTKRRVSAAWHGTLLDPQPQGASLAIVQLNGPLSDLVGERVRVTAGTRSTVVFVHRETDLDLDDDTQISLSRRAWQALDRLAEDSLQVTVEVIPASVED